MIRIGSYAIQADTDCWQFGKVSTKKKPRKRGEPESDETIDYIINPSFPATLDSALRRYVETTVRDADPGSWQDVKDALDRANKELYEIRRVLESAQARDTAS
jgi:hypothetical protein